MLTYTTGDVVLALNSASIDERTGNKVLYNVSFKADCDSMIGTRSEDYVRRELRWFWQASDSLDDMEPPIPKAWQACAGDDNKVNSAYGHTLLSPRGDSGRSLYQRAVDAFVNEGLGTRHSIALISDRDVHELHHKDGRNDFICTNALCFNVTPDGKLHITAQMRSMDAVWGYRADYSMWDSLMDTMVNDLNKYGLEVTRGDIFFQVANIHVYPRHFQLLDDAASDVDDEMNRKLRRIWIDAHVKAQQSAEQVPTPALDEAVSEQGWNPLERLAS